MKKLFVALLFIVLVSGCVAQTPSTTFIQQGTDVCNEDGKPVIVMFSATWCPHCNWIGPTFDRVAEEYAAQGKIAAYHWQLDTGDNDLTDAVETAVPAKFKGMFDTYSPEGSVPVFVFGCAFYRVGNGHEAQEDLAAEEADFRAILDHLTK